MSERQQQQKCDLPLDKHRTHRNEEDSDGGSSSRGRKKGRGNYGKGTRRYQHEEYELQPPQLQKDDGNMEMKGVQKYQARHTPYTVEHGKRRVQWHKKGRLHVTVWTNRNHFKREMGENTQDQTLGTWFKVTIPCGRKYDKTWLMDTIQSHCSVPFTPVDFHYVRKRARFFVQDARAASELKAINHKICDEEDQKIAIFVNTSAVPYSVQDKLEPEEMEQLKLAMSKRYDVSQKALDLRKLRFDRGFAHLGIDIILNRRSCMAATLQIIEKNFPELLSLNLCNNKLYQLDGLSDIIQMAPKVKILNLSRNGLKSGWELGKLKGLKLEELWLEGNPLCDNFRSQFTYISAIRKCFPKLLRLDGQELAPPITIDLDRPYLVKPLIQESCKEVDALKTQVLRFVQQYYLIYDFGDRQSLLGAYHDEACFSLTIPFTEDPTSSSLFEYFKDNRNMKLKDPNLHFQLLKHTKHDIVSSLCGLPKTEHDLNSFVVDMSFQSESLYFFCVNGIFKEVEESSQGAVRAFTRTSVAIPTSDSSLCVVNEELFVRIATPIEAQRAFSTQLPAPSSSTEPTLSLKQDPIWDEPLVVSEMKGRIPEEAFK